VTLPARAGSGLRALLAEGTVALEAAGIESAALDAEVLLAHCLGLDRGRLLLAATLRPAEDAPEAPARHFHALLARRAAREPVAYLTGHREFWSLDLEVTPDVLIPRPETELVVREALDCLSMPGSPGSPLADVGTGSGAIAIALACELPGARIVASDMSAPALQVARRNVEKHSVADRVGLVQGDLLEMVRGPLALVAANPPYIARGEHAGLMPEVRDHEPEAALVSGATGMEAIERLVARAGRILTPGGWLVIEIDSGRWPAVQRLLETAVWQNVCVRADYAGLPRVARARRSTG